MNQHHNQASHFWFGRWVADADLEGCLGALAEHIDQNGSAKFPLQALLSACDQVAGDLEARRGCYEEMLAEACTTAAREDAQNMLQAIAGMLKRDALQEKLRRELGSDEPARLRRCYPGREYEAWAACGCVVHIAPANVFTAACMGMVEGLITGNINVVKVSARDGRCTQILAHALVQASQGVLAPYMAVVQMPSSRQEWLRALLARADAVSVWGGEKAVAGVRAMAPAQARLISWGHKISFAYISSDSLANEEFLQGIARDVCRLDQQACSSPQTILAETDPAGLAQIAARLAAHLGAISPGIAAQQPDQNEQAEISTVMAVARCEQALGLCSVHEDPDGAWRIIVDERSGLRPSPLFRTIWLKPVERAQLAAILRPMRPWLQTCGLAAGMGSIAILSRTLIAAGVSRISRPGEMIDSYNGAPHDGVYALQQLVRRISVDGPDFLKDFGSLEVLEPFTPAAAAAVPVMDKQAFQALNDSAQSDPKAGLVVRSGGSSGNIAYSSFRWADYHKQMAATADGLVAAGLDPARDRIMNLFACGHMYGSFISFWTIFEHLGALQLPMAMVPEYDQIAEQIIAQNANTVAGITPHLLALFAEQGERLKNWGGLQKVFYGGEPMSAAQQKFLREHCGVSLIRSAAYGSNDAGPMGYQCRHCEGSVHHLLGNLQSLEILDMESDRPVKGHETGRLVLSPIARSVPKIQRYEIGDLGRWVSEPCPCGSHEPRFELLGRMGDVFKAGPLMNYNSFLKYLGDHYNYRGPLQIHLDNRAAGTRLDLWVDESWDETNNAQAITALFRDYEPLQTVKTYNLPTSLHIISTPKERFFRNKVSGKFIHVCDHRNSD